MSQFSNAIGIYLFVRILNPTEYPAVYEAKQERYYSDVRRSGHTSSRRRQVSNFSFPQRNDLSYSQSLAERFSGHPGY